MDRSEKYRVRSGVSADFLYRPYAMQVLSVYKVLQQARCAVRTTKTLDYKDEVAD